MLEFRVSEKVIKRTSRWLRLFPIGFGLFLAGSTLFASWQLTGPSLLFNSPLSLLSLLPVLIVIPLTLIFNVVGKRTLTQLRRQRLKVSGEGLERGNGSWVDRANFEEIETVRVTKDGKGEINSLIVQTPKLNLDLSALEDKLDIVAVLQERVPDAPLRVTKRTWRHATLLILGGFALGGAAIWLPTRLLQNVPNAGSIFNIIWMLGFAAFMFARRNSSNGLQRTHNQGRLHLVFALASIGFMLLIYFII